MYMSKHCTYVKHNHSKPEDHTSSRIVICHIGYPLKNCAGVKDGKEEGGTYNKGRNVRYT